MLHSLLLMVLKVLVGTSLGLLGVYNSGNKKKKMRIFDELNPETQNAIVVSCVRYAKGEIAELNLPAITDVIQLSIQYDTMYFTTIMDFQGLNIENIPAFVGPRPIKRPM